MNGIHDMGGMQDMGPIRPEKNEPVFHAPWEGRMYAMNIAVDGDWPDGAGRFQRELIPPADYLRMSYYEKWLAGLVALMLKSGMVTQAELDSGRALVPVKRKLEVLAAAEVAPMVAKGFPSSRDVPATALFRLGQRVRARTLNPPSHTRLPRYARGKLGSIALDHGVFGFPDTASQGLGDKPQHVYSVRFTARELWGQAASSVDSVYLDLWDDHLESA
jgi:nitrile hydratase subunit beta